jgi:EAL domain-containing protein (putative c-di-GMP-specific phosphodiesterase class I)
MLTKNFHFYRKEVIMPKLKEVFKKTQKELEKFADSAGEKLEYVTSDKDERTEECFKKLSENGVALCFANTGQQITSYNQIKDITVGRIGVIDQSIIQYCLEQYAKQGIVKCQQPIDSTENIGNLVPDTSDEQQNLEL